jgi:hypothetical protein
MQICEQIHLEFWLGNFLENTHIDIKLDLMKVECDVEWIELA